MRYACGIGIGMTLVVEAESEEDAQRLVQELVADISAPAVRLVATSDVTVVEEPSHGAGPGTVPGGN